MNISINLTVSDDTVSPFTIDRLDQLTIDAMKEWAEYNWSNSHYWIVPNIEEIANEIFIEHEVFPGREQLSRKIIVPIKSYDGIAPIHEWDYITITPKYSN